MPVNIEKQELTVQELTEQQTQLEIISKDTKDDPYKNLTPKHLLEREYQIASFNLSVGSPQFIIYPFDLLLTKTTVLRYLSLFRFFRAGVRLRVTMISNQMQYGILWISMLPYVQNPARWMNEYQLSQQQLQLLDVSQQQAFEVDLPFISPYLYYDFNDPAAFKQWRVVFTLKDFHTITTTATNYIELNIFANFIDTETAGYQPAVFQMNPTHQPMLRRLAHAADSFSNLGAVGGSFLYGAAKSQVTKVVGAGVVGAGLKLASDNLGGETATYLEETFLEKAQLDLCSDLTAPVIHRVSGPALGDRGWKNFRNVPDMLTKTSIKELAMTPVYLNTVILTTAVEVYEIFVSPMFVNSHAFYLANLFKYYHGGTRIFVKIAASPFVSARLMITLFPVGVTSTDLENIGDLPTWVISIKGPTEFSVGIPYLFSRPWMAISNGDNPILSFRLLEPLVQPFDKDVSITLMSFGSAAEDIEFAGLQSCAPIDFQCSVESSMSQIRLMGGTQLHKYQGGVSSIYDVLGRFSTRNIDVNNFSYPFPLLIPSKALADKYDNFDFLAQIFLFYSGDIHSKVLFSAAPAGGVLQVAVGNSKFPNVSQQFFSGNSISVTHQAVWPLLEYTYPYLSEFEFDSIYTPYDMYPQYYSEGAVIDKIWLSASPSFKHHITLPLPDFWFEPPVVFQSFQRLSTYDTYLGRFTLNTAGFETFSIPWTQDDLVLQIDIEGTVQANSGLLIGQSFFLALSPSNDPFVITSQHYTDNYIISTLVRCEPTIDYVAFSFKGSWTHLGGPPPRLYFLVLPYDNPTASFDFTYVAKFRPYSDVIQINSFQMSSGAYVAELASVTDTVPVFIEGQPVLATIDAIASPVQVITTPLQPLEVVGPTTSFPPVQVEGLLLPSVISVQGVPNPDFPVQVSYY